MNKLIKNNEALMPLTHRDRCIIIRSTIKQLLAAISNGDLISQVSMKICFRKPNKSRYLCGLKNIITFSFRSN